MFTQPFIQAQIKENIKAPCHWHLWGKFTGDRWIPRTKGQWYGDCFHLTTSSCNLFYQKRPSVVKSCIWPSLLFAVDSMVKPRLCSSYEVLCQCYSRPMWILMILLLWVTCVKSHRQLFDTEYVPSCSKIEKLCKLHALLDFVVSTSRFNSYPLGLLRHWELTT